MRITTWNMQGKQQHSCLQQLIALNDPDVICLQECGDLSPVIEHQLPIIGQPYSLTGKFYHGKVMYDVLFWCSLSESTSHNSVAIMSRAEVDDQGILTPANVPGLREASFQTHSLPWMRLKQGDHPITIYSYQAPSAPLTHTCRFTNQLVATIHAGGGVRAIVGDFNANPLDPNFITPPSGTLVRGQRPTKQGGDLISYSITTPMVFFHFEQPGEQLGRSEHYPQNFIC